MICPACKSEVVDPYEVLTLEVEYYDAEGNERDVTVHGPCYNILSKALIEKLAL